MFVSFFLLYAGILRVEDGCRVIFGICEYHFHDFLKRFPFDSVRKVVVYARNACWDIAKELGLQYFCVLDDDYSMFGSRYVEGEKLMNFTFNDLDAVFDAFVEFLDERCGKIDELILEKSSLIEDLESYKRSLIYETVTGKRKVV